MNHELTNILAQINLSEIGKDSQNLLTEITLSKITQACLISLGTYWGAIICEKFVTWLSERVPTQYRIGVKQSLPILRAIILIFASVIVLNLFVNLSANNLLALTGTTAVALGFAFKDYASSVIAGLVALLEAPYRVGDRVAIGDYYGEVVDFGLREIRLTTPNDSLVTIPHNKIWTEAIVNSNDGKLECQVVADFYLSHSVDIQQVVDILRQAAYTSKYNQVTLPVLVTLEEQRWGTIFHLKSYVMDAREEMAYKTDLIKRVKQAFTKANLTYPVPTKLPPNKSSDSSKD
ncbi:MAG: mechanosensitive ion channel family protein [Oscillatoria sp. PMC 1068.18]|nr:mechanosensitive ion channel family protein [Oscillatoria sp. PMC 1076.18]MEC4988123.1 mechanosensitive ion channel family protein [Oscillatoria sp. PMC 1068.18]